ncbi:MAG: SPASM domain-containing protein [Actinomycetes bacterium]
MFRRRPSAPEPDLRPVRRTAPPEPRHACLAPSVQLYLATDGDVRACCRNWERLGNVTSESLLDIWRGRSHRDLVQRLNSHDFSAGCEQCHAETEIEGRADAYPSLFDGYTESVEELGDGAGLMWPSRIEFNLSNRCNLMCIQCDGLLSSAIRAHRDGLPALPAAYGDRFFADLEHFIPHLTEAQFAGGEPFFARENFRVWEMVTRLNPQLPCIVITNATQWNDRIDRVTSEVRMGFTFSIDALTAPTYESIRINADHGTVMENIDRYIAKSEAADMPVEVNFCLMRQNIAEFGFMMLWIESKGMKANVSVVRSPPDCSLASMSQRELNDAVDRLERIAPAVSPHLGAWNRPVWERELDRLRRWAEASDDERDSLWWASLTPVTPRSQLGLTIRSREEVDTDAARSWVAEVATPEEVHWLAIRATEPPDVPGPERAVDVPPVVVECSPGVPALLAGDESDVVGVSIDELFARLQEVHGSVLATSVEEVGESRIDTHLTLERAVARTSVLARRDGSDRTTGADVYLAIVKVASPAPR